MSQDIQTYCTDLATRARRAALALSDVPAQRFDAALKLAADRIDESTDSLRRENNKDLEAGRAASLSSALVDRLTLTPARLKGIADSLREVAALPCPRGKVQDGWVMYNGLRLSKVRVPIGVILMIYESRPNVTTEAAALCLKSGNAAILRGGKEAYHTNVALWKIVQQAMQDCDVPPEAVQLVETTDREAVGSLLSMDSLIDVTIPRGGKALIERVVSEARMPVIKHYEGICHVYVHSDAEVKMAEAICLNAKVQRPGVCNAMETLLVHRDIAEQFLPQVARCLSAEGVELRGCAISRKLVPEMGVAGEDDWRREYLDLVLSVRVVDGLDEAIDHINTFGSHHTDAIVTNTLAPAEVFKRRVDSACVFVNCSTRFSDGGQFGLGAEIGISTDKIHARGPMGLTDLTTYKYVVEGEGQIRT